MEEVISMLMLTKRIQHKDIAKQIGVSEEAYPTT